MKKDTLRCPYCKGDMRHSKPDQNGNVIWNCDYCKATLADKISTK